MDDLRVRPQTERDRFVTEYFLQTRREIDAEKGERDKIINFILLVFGGLGFALFDVKNGPQLVTEPSPYVFGAEASLFVILLSLFNARHQKLRQIHHRWDCLAEILKRNHGDLYDYEPNLERTVTSELKSKAGIRIRRYYSKDAFLFLAFTSPLAILLMVHSWMVFHGVLQYISLVLLAAVEMLCLFWFGGLLRAVWEWLSGLLHGVALASRKL